MSDKSVISRHLRNIFLENELDKNSVVANFATTASDLKRNALRLLSLHDEFKLGLAKWCFTGL